MMQLLVTDRAGTEYTIKYKVGYTLKEAIIEGGLEEILAMTSCGGYGSCGTCQVFVDPEKFECLPEMHPNEDALLDINPKRKCNSRLSCQINLTKEMSGLKITIAPEL